MATASVSGLVPGSSMRHWLRILSTRGLSLQSTRTFARTTTTTTTTTSAANQCNSPSGSASVSPAEIAKFAALADEWWDSRGPYGALHRLNYARTPFIRVAVCNHHKRSSRVRRPLSGLGFLEVGCGGGILSESLAVLGARVTAIDAAKESILVAKEHAKRNALITTTLSDENIHDKHKDKDKDGEDTQVGKLTYLATTAEALQESLASGDGHEEGDEDGLYDVVVSSEVIEHVVNPPAFCKTLASLVKPGGLVILSTLNRTIWSYSLAIVAAEDVLGMAPKGAHEWDQFVTPEELSIMCKDAGLELEVISGMKWNIAKMQFELSEDKSINYIAAFTKPAS